MRHEAVIDGTLVSWLPSRRRAACSTCTACRTRRSCGRRSSSARAGSRSTCRASAESGKTAGWPYSLEGYAAFLPAFLDHLGIDRVRVVAHDWGAVALTLGDADRAAGGDRHAAAAPRPPLAVDRARLAHAGGGRAGDGLHRPHAAAPRRRPVGRARRPGPAPLRPRHAAGDPQALPRRRARTWRRWTRSRRRRWCCGASAIGTWDPTGRTGSRPRWAARRRSRSSPRPAIGPGSTGQKSCKSCRSPAVVSQLTGNGPLFGGFDSSPAQIVPLGVVGSTPRRTAFRQYRPARIGSENSTRDSGESRIVGGLPCAPSHR